MYLRLSTPKTPFVPARVVCADFACQITDLVTHVSEAGVKHFLLSVYCMCSLRYQTIYHSLIKKGAIHRDIIALGAKTETPS